MAVTHRFSTWLSSLVIPATVIALELLAVLIWVVAENAALVVMFVVVALGLHSLVRQSR